jgi:hypothetical protein
VEAVRAAEDDRDRVFRWAQERYEDEVRAAESEAREAVESACNASNTALQAAHRAAAQAADRNAASASGREGAVGEAELVRSRSINRATEERSAALLEAYVVHGRALEDAEDARSREWRDLPDPVRELVIPGDEDRQSPQGSGP